MHHSSEYYNLTTALRQGMFQEFGTTFFECLYSFILPPPMFLTHKALNTVYQFWIHNEVGLNTILWHKNEMLDFNKAKNRIIQINYLAFH